MRTPASIAGHPIHPMLIPLPIGLWIFSLVCDLVYSFGGGGETWHTVAFYTMVGGVVGALIAAIPGVIDMLSLPQGPRKTAVVHMTINLTIVGLYLINIWLRTGNPEDVRLTMWMSVISVVLLSVSGWLGGKMVYEQHVAVNTGEEAHVHLGGEKPRAIRT
jgi:uncharacterized membrane protein